MRKFDLAMAPTTPPLATPGTVNRSGDSGPQIESHRQHLYDSQYLFKTITFYYTLIKGKVKNYE